MTWVVSEGDCVAVMAGMGEASVDAVVTDPPYGLEFMDEQTGELASHDGAGWRHRDDVAGYDGGWKAASGPGFGDKGGASRFFYCAKASSRERNAGLDGFEAVEAIRYSEQGQGPMPQQTPRKPVAQRNVHPTVKPVELMRWLVRLVTPKGGRVLDPFCGSGTTGIAAALEGFEFVGVEREPEYAAIARARIQWWADHPEGEVVEAPRVDRKQQSESEQSGQLGLFAEERPTGGET